MFCANCGNKLESADKFCDRCGIASDISSPRKKPTVSKVILQTTVSSENKIQPSQNETKGFVYESKTNSKKYLWGGIAFIVLGLIGLGIYQDTQHKKQEQQAQKAAFEKNLQLIQEGALQAQKIANLKSVVNIVCDDGSGGSGTIFSKDGLVLTNNHVIARAKSCAITLPDPTSGVPIYIYEAKPIIVPDLSEQYDIAMLEIDNSYTDSDGKTWGDYPTSFPAYARLDSCDNSDLQLGDSIKIYGYPVTSGGYNLTVTEGIISSFSDDGNILTSAKIDSGNSGGFAIDQNGCFLGIPSAVIEGKYQNLGVIISTSIIKEFVNQIPESQN